MTSEETREALHTKILDVFRSKSLKKNVKDPRETLFFKIKPEKAVSEFIIPYRDLRDNFPYALIEYYEEKIKIKNKTAANFEKLLAESVDNVSKRKNSIIEEKSEPKKSSKKQKEKDQKLLTEAELKESHPPEEESNPNYLPILDFDEYMQEKDIPVTKFFHAVFSETEPSENRYLKDLNNDENNMYSRRNESNSSSYENKRKKFRTNYNE